MAAKRTFALLHVPDFDDGKASTLRIGGAARDGFGWRDHTDGNRISTTRGDKIEVVGGRYQTIVLGRGQGQAGWEAREGQVGQSGITVRGKSNLPSHTRSLERGPRGELRVIDTSVKGEAESTYYGDTIDRQYGGRSQSLTGSEARALVSYADDAGSHSVTTENPRILEKTWAEKIESYTGSEKRRIPAITDETWVEITTSATHATSITETTEVTGESKSTTTAKTITAETTAASMRDTTTVKGGTITGTTTAAKIVSKTYADTEDTIEGNTSSHQTGNTDATVDGIETTVNLGMVNEVVLGAMTDTTVGATVSVDVGASLDLGMSYETQICLGAKLESSFGVMLEMGSSKISLSLDKSKVAPSRKVVAAFILLG
jgi:hypothetical protein